MHLAVVSPNVGSTPSVLKQRVCVSVDPVLHIPFVVLPHTQVVPLHTLAIVLSQNVDVPHTQEPPLHVRPVSQTFVAHGSETKNGN